MAEPVDLDELEREGHEWDHGQLLRAARSLGVTLHEARAETEQLKADIAAEVAGKLALRARFGARDNETWPMFIERLCGRIRALEAEVAQFRERLSEYECVDCGEETTLCDCEKGPTDET